MATTEHPASCAQPGLAAGDFVDVHGVRLTFAPVSRRGDARPAVEVTRIVDGRRIDQLMLDEWPTDLAPIADAWVAQRVGAVPPEPTCCRSCGVELTPEANVDTDYQFDNALWITFSGGYGMFVDPDPDVFARHPTGLRAVICHACAHELCAAHPWIDELLEPANSHSHHYEQIPSLIRSGHFGWDIDRYKMDGGEQLARHLVDAHGVDEGMLIPGTVVHLSALLDGALVSEEAVRELWLLHYERHDAGCDHDHEVATGEPVAR